MIWCGFLHCNLASYCSPLTKKCTPHTYRETIAPNIIIEGNRHCNYCVQSYWYRAASVAVTKWYHCIQLHEYVNECTVVNRRTHEEQRLRSKNTRGFYCNRREAVQGTKACVLGLLPLFCCGSNKASSSGCIPRVGWGKRVRATLPRHHGDAVGTLPIDRCNPDGSRRAGILAVERALCTMWFKEAWRWWRPSLQRQLSPWVAKLSTSAPQWWQECTVKNGVRWAH